MKIMRIGVMAALGAALSACSTIAPQQQIATPPPAPEPAPAAMAQLQPVGIPTIARLSIPETVATDVIGTLRRQFSLPTSDNPAVQTERAWFSRNPDYITRVLTRSEPVLYHIASQLEARGMPADLALLPIIESAFDPFAYSHGRAAGLWQIIPGTGRRLGLKQNWWFDGRRDLVESTRAALDYLQLLHERFAGDWLLAVAGYNSGEGNVDRALRRAAERDEPLDFWHISKYLPRETRTYVPRLIAVRDAVAEAESAGIELPVIRPEPWFTAVDLEGQIDMSLAASLAGMPVDDLYALNPAVNRWATDPEGPHRLLIPADRASTFASSLATLDPAEHVQWSRHLIARGESLIVIARDYGTTPDVLRAVNELRSNTIRAGDYLMVPHAMRSLDTYTASVEMRATRRQEQAAGEHRIEHRVVRGDSLWSIAQKYDVNLRALARWNSMAPGDVLSVGKILTIWKDGEVAAAPVAGPGNRQALREIRYQVRRGDSLARIASRFRVSIGDIAEWNNISVEKYLQPGQQIIMFVDVTQQSS